MSGQKKIACTKTCADKKSFGQRRIRTTHRADKMLTCADKRKSRVAKFCGQEIIRPKKSRGKKLVRTMKSFQQK
jgi:hypothetical protein